MNAEAPAGRLLRGVYALIDPARGALQPFVDGLLLGGIRLFQVRAKAGIRRDELALLAQRVRVAGGLTLMNDDVELAEVADGVHLGQEDAARHDLRALRVRLGARIIGLSCGTPAESRAAAREPVDYLGVGPIFTTGSKDDAGRPIGVNGVRAVVRATALPVAAIGGIAAESMSRVRETGAVMAAVISACYIGDDPVSAARALVDAWNQ